jgi:hypothetical protein
MDHILAEHRVEFGITSAENPRPEHLPECKRKWKMETKTEMTMIHAVESWYEYSNKLTT